VPGVFAAGESTGIGGGPKAKAEGHLAGLAIAAALGHRRRQGSARSKVRKANHFARLIQRIAQPV